MEEMVGRFCGESRVLSLEDGGEAQHNWVGISPRTWQMGLHVSNLDEMEFWIYFHGSYHEYLKKKNLK